MDWNTIRRKHVTAQSSMFYLDISMMLAISPSINDPKDVKTTVPVPFLTTGLPEGQCEMSSAFIMIFLQKSDDMLRVDNVTFSIAGKKRAREIEADLALDKTIKISLFEVKGIVLHAMIKLMKTCLD